MKKFYNIKELKQKFPGKWFWHSNYYSLSNGSGAYIDHFFESYAIECRTIANWRIEYAGCVSEVSEKEVKIFYKTHFKMNNFI